MMAPQSKEQPLQKLPANTQKHANVQEHTPVNQGWHVIMWHYYSSRILNLKPREENNRSAKLVPIEIRWDCPKMSKTSRGLLASSSIRLKLPEQPSTSQVLEKIHGHQVFRHLDVAKKFFHVRSWFFDLPGLWLDDGSSVGGRPPPTKVPANTQQRASSFQPLPKFPDSVIPDRKKNILKTTRSDISTSSITQAILALLDLVENFARLELQKQENKRKRQVYNN